MDNKCSTRAKPSVRGDELFVREVPSNYKSRKYGSRGLPKELAVQLRTFSETAHPIGG